MKEYSQLERGFVSDAEKSCIKGGSAFKFVTTRTTI